jgi:hypothetical protein
MGKKVKSRDKRKAQGDALEKRMKKSKAKAQGKGRSILRDDVDVQLWRPKDGNHLIDIIPYRAGKNDPEVNQGDETYMFEYYVHRGVGPSNTWFLCLAETYGKPCPICEHRQKLRDKGADKEVWKKLFPSQRNLYNVVSFDKGEHKKGVQIWDVPHFYFEKHLMAIAYKSDRHGNEKRINFASAKNGKSISFVIEPAKSKDDYASFVGHSFDDRDYKIKQSVLDQARVLDELIIIPSYEEVEQAYWAGEVPGSKKDKKGKGKKKGKEDKVQSLIDELEDIEEMEDLEEFIEEHELNVKIKKKDDEDDVKSKIIEALKEKDGDDDDEDEDDEEEDTDDDDGEDDDEDEDESEDDEDDEEEDEDEDSDGDDEDSD